MKSGKKLYLECYSGISGDMTVAALLDLGVDEKVLTEALESLPVPGFSIEIKRVAKSGIDACDFNVILDAAHENHDHDMNYLHGHAHHHSHEHGEKPEHSCGHSQEHIFTEKEEGRHSSNHEHHHSHEEEYGSHHHNDGHSHDHHHSHHHEHRGMPEIRQIINQGKMTKEAKNLALKIFEILAEAESKAHNVPVDEVHFHEVGAVDSIVDIVAVAVCLDNLQIQEVIVPVLCEGTGTVRCQHGILPVPVPAVANIIKAHKLPVRIVDAEGEFVTPTGAAIVAAIRTSESLPKEFLVEDIGIGAGKRNYERPGILRAMLIQDNSQERDTIYKLESNIDDCTGEILGYVMEQLFEAGARDVHYTPVFMKKNRPAWQLNVICKEEDIERLEQIIFQETTTIGIRRVEMERSILKREEKTVSTAFGQAEVKICEARGVSRVYPEYESVAKLAKENQVPFSKVYQIVQKSCSES